jgi:polyvinyl alcohol dehydrogenase (cytochrome)
MPSTNRLLYALDAASGCQHWSFETDAPVRAAVAVATPAAAGKVLVFLADTRAIAYAVDAATGELVWRTTVDTHPRASVRGAVAYFDGRLFVPVTAAEEGLTPNDGYECCTARGSLVALDAATGRLLWKTHTIEAEARPVGKTAAGTTMLGPSGASIWSAPTIDAERRLVYAATGNNFSQPATRYSNSIIAFDIADGHIVWGKQLVSGDVWNNACLSGAANCPASAGPDHDIAAPPMLVTRANGTRLLLVGQKSGVAWALNPDRQGEVVWRTQVGQGIPVFGSILFGIATDGEKMYVAIGDLAYVDPSVPAARRQLDPKAGGGLRALDVATGCTIWSAPAPTCDRPDCSPAQVAPISVMPGVVFAGAMDGRIRAYAALDGKVLWEFDTARPFETVNKVSAEGGSTRPAAPLVVDGVLYVGAGPRSGAAGSVLVAFSTPPGITVR